MWPGSALLVQPEQAGPLVRQYAAEGYQQIKAYSQLTRETLQALGMASAEAGLRMTGHCPNGLAFEEAIAAGMTCFEHLEQVQNGHLQDSLDLAALATLSNIPRFRQLNRAIDYDKMRRLGHQMAAEHIWNCPTLVLPQQMSQDLTRALRSPLLAYESQATLSQWNPANDVRFERMRTTREEWASVIQEVVEVLIGIVAVFHEEGAPLLLGTDTPNPFVFQGFSVHQELANLRSAGLTPFEALRCGTSEAARFVGQMGVGHHRRGQACRLTAHRGQPPHRCGGGSRHRCSVCEWLPLLA
jgi:imidazolonepropionase-like amidohydrolase